MFLFIIFVVCAYGPIRPLSLKTIRYVSLCQQQIRPKKVKKKRICQYATALSGIGSARVETLPSFFVRYFSQPFVVWSFGPDSNQRQCLKGNIYLLFLFNSFKYFISRAIIMFHLCNNKKGFRIDASDEISKRKSARAWLLTLFWWFRTDSAAKNDWRKQK